MTLRALTIVALFTGISLVGACSDTNIIIPTSPSNLPVTTGSPLPNAPVVQTHKIEFRVTGNALGARIRYNNSNDGTAQVTTTLPFVFNLTTNQQSMFLSIDATPTSYPFLLFPFMSVQIFVNGLLFREASSADFLLSTITASGTWRQ
jgi:hypothetical protein